MPVKKILEMVNRPIWRRYGQIYVAYFFAHLVHRNFLFIIIFMTNGKLCISAHLQTWRRWIQTQGCRTKRQSRRIRCDVRMTERAPSVVSAVVTKHKITQHGW